jgi:hypothetical protein
MDSLGMSTPPVVPINLKDVREYAQDFPWINGTTGEDMNGYYDDFKNHGKGYYIDDSLQEWAVYNYKGANGTAFSTAKEGDGFRGKVIWLIESNNFEGNSKFYQHKNSGSAVDRGLTFVYVGPGKRVFNVGGADVFRGFIYSVTAVENIFTAQNGCEFRGGIYQSNPAGLFRLIGGSGGGATFDVHYDQGVMDELKGLGIFTDPDETESEVVTARLQLNPNFTNPIASLVSRSL